MSKKQTIQTFWDRVGVKDLESCWPWLGSINSTGYGTVSFLGKMYTAHRVAAKTLGLISSPMAPINRRGSGFILHTCDNKLCCNPTHHEIGTYKQNQEDAYKRGRRKQPAGAEHVNAKLAPGQIAAIRRKLVAGAHTQSELGRIYKVSQGCISKISRMETYTCL